MMQEEQGASERPDSYAGRLQSHGQPLQQPHTLLYLLPRRCAAGSGWPQPSCEGPSWALQGPGSQCHRASSRSDVGVLSCSRGYL